MAAAAGEKKTKKRGLLAVVAILTLGVIGGGVGMMAPYLMTGSANAASSAEEVAPVNIQNLEVGRIVVNLKGENGDAGTAKHLVIETIVTYDAALIGAGGEPSEGGYSKEEGGGPADSLRPQVRDAFIEYLANISESEVRGSSGMASLREELLRRARVAFANDAPKSLLIQDYVLQ